MTEKKEKNEKKQENVQKLRKLLVTGALSLALISWYTTANGLHIYVFEHIWQAYIVSASLQGALFALSIKGIDLIYSFDTKWKKACLILLWGGLLASSSIFSYIYISGDVYTDTLLQQDAQRILNTFCLGENYDLCSEMDKLLSGTENAGNNGIENKMNEYVALLANTEGGIQYSASEESELEFARRALLPYAYEYAQTGDSINMIIDCVNTTYLVSKIDTVLSGKYTSEDINTINEEISNITASIDTRKSEIQKEIDTLKARERDYQNRLDGFRNTSDSAYLALTNMLADTQNDINTKDELEKALTKEAENINTAKSVIENVGAGINASLYGQVLLLHEKLNEEEVKIENIQGIAEDIYEILLTNNVPADDERLAGYTEFRNNLRKYEAVIATEEKLKNERDELYMYSSNMNLSITNSDLDNSNSSADINISEWNTYWQARMNGLKESVQLLQSAGLDSTVCKETIESISQRERLYLSDLNDFERAFSLLFGKEHEYKGLLIFSIVFSFGLDLFAAFMSILLFLIKDIKDSKPV